MQGVNTMSFSEVAQTDQIPAGTMKAVTVNGKYILVTNVGGKFYAIGGKCTHMGGDLSKGILEGNIVTCPRHGSQFDVTTGKSLRGPKIILRFSTKDESVYEVKVEGKSIQMKV
jgi:3-phenylpropionate/trans-cinnamate dioxygenase ferredoxin component